MGEFVAEGLFAGCPAEAGDAIGQGMPLPFPDGCGEPEDIFTGGHGLDGESPVAVEFDIAQSFDGSECGIDVFDPGFVADGFAG